MWGMILSFIFGSGTDLIKQWQENAAKKQQAKADLQVAYLENKTRLMLSKDEYNHSWEMEALKNSSTSLKWGSFILFAGPIGLTWVLALFDNVPMAERAWAAMMLVPEYWRYGFTAMTGSIWGVAALKDMGGMRSMIGAFSGDKKVFIPPTQEAADMSELDAAADDPNAVQSLITKLTR